ncbi:CBO0543 family protein [Priestia sp. SIMBA_032]|uniref:CBO0543 family protein n=1 Tax=Priestia sp. SIMBA_032 TaxID=3085775 RepID=UPI00397AF01F
MRNKLERRFLKYTTIIFLGSLPLVLKKVNIKDSLLILFMNGYTNAIVDMFLVNRNILSYPVRFIRKEFKLNVLFDLLYLPTVSLWLYQLTKNDKPFKIIVKIVSTVSSLFLFELWAEKNTKLIKWKKGWKWYYSLISLNVRTLFSRLVIEIIHIIEKKQKN